MIKLNFKQLEEKAILPTQKYSTDAGWDIYSIEDIILQPGKTVVIRTGIALQMGWDFLPFDNSNFNQIPVLSQPDHMGFIDNFTYYTQEWFKQQYKFLFQIESRSGFASKGIHVVGGIVDQDYRGEFKVILANTGKASYRVVEGERIAQGIPSIIPKISNTQWVVNEEFEKTDRGENGFGSSGK